MGSFRGVYSMLGVLVAIFTSAGPANAGEPCAPEWVPTFGPASGLDRGFTVGAVFDDGSGPALYLAGPFTIAGGIEVNGIAKWDGEKWSGLGAGLGNAPTSVTNAMTVFDDGSGPALYAAGLFATAGGVPVNNIAKWSGDEWSPLGDGLAGPHPTVNALRVYNDGSGDALYAGGAFTIAGGAPTNNIAKWNGKQWSAVGGGVTTLGGVVHAIDVFDDGGGEELIIGGAFATVGGVSAFGVASWNGASWNALGGGVGGGSTVYSIASFAQGGQQTLFVGGQFSTAGGVSVANIARWDGAEWASVGAGINTSVRQLIEHDGALFATTGLLDNFRWDGMSWSDPFPELITPGGGRLAVFNEGDGPSLFVGNSSIILTDDIIARGVGRWDGKAWSPVGDGLAQPVSALEFFDEGSGPRLFVAGGQPFVDGRTLELARWDGATWSDVGGGITGNIETLMTWNDGAGPALYMGGMGFSAGGVDTFGLIRWDGEAWTDVGGGVTGPPSIKQVNAFEEFDDDGDGHSSLFVAGIFNQAGGLAANSIAKWDGAEWSSLGDGIGVFNGPGGPQPGVVRVMQTHDDGSGAALYVGGAFHMAGDIEVFGIARWDGVEWSPVGDGQFIPSAFEVFDDGAASSLYASSGSQIRRWDGAEWSIVGAVSLGGSVSAMKVFDDGDGSALYIGGAFDSIDGVPANSIAKWDGKAWAAVEVEDPTTQATVLAFASKGNASHALGGLFVGSNFEGIVPSGDDYLARYVGCATACPADTNGDGVVNFADLNAVLGAFGQSGADLPADLNDDGIVDFSDLNAVLSNFGAPCG